MAEIKNATKITCTRCNGSGRFSFNLVRGTVCFGCEGVGYKIVDGKKHAAAQARKAKREAAKKAEAEYRIAAGMMAWEAKVFRFRNDPRIGPKTRERCAQFEAVAYEIYTALQDFDAGTQKLHESFFRNIAE